MKFELIISTMGKDNIDDMNLTEKNINTNCVVINQCDKEDLTISNNIKMVKTKSLGLSKSRNLGINNAEAKICMISDDDVKYLDNLEQIIINEFEKNNDFDILTFQVITPEGELFKNYSNKEMIHTKKSILNVSSIEVAFKLNSIKHNNIKFDELFGLGAKYISGEENIFLKECLDSGLKIKYVPIPVAVHPKESSGKILNEKAIYSKGALFYRLFGFKSILLNLAFILKKHKIINFGIIHAIVLIYKGMIEYIKDQKVAK